MKHGVLMTVHNNIPVVQALMSLLDDERFTFYLLVDKKSKHSPEEFIPDLKRAKVVTLDRININWGGYSQIEAQLRLMERAVQNEVDYLHYVQGADLPLKTPEQIDRFCKQGGIFLEVSAEPSACANYRVLCKHFFADFPYYRETKLLRYANHGLAYLQRPFMRLKKQYNGMFMGYATWSIPLSFTVYVLSMRNEIERRYRYSVTADEVFLQTLCMQSEYKSQVRGKNAARLIDWSRREGNSPRTFTIEDKTVLEEAIKDPELLFARKFSAERDYEIVEYVITALNKNEDSH